MNEDSKRLIKRLISFNKVALEIALVYSIIRMSVLGSMVYGFYGGGRVFWKHLWQHSRSYIFLIAAFFIVGNLIIIFQHLGHQRRSYGSG
jgi:hypothetical protein